MKFWRSFWSWLGGDGTSRNAGEQMAGPSGGSAPTPVDVTEDTAMQLSAVWACVRLLAETVASLPFNIYRRTDNGRVLAPEHWLHQLMSGKVNRYQTRVEFMETMMLNLVLHGNAYAKITRVGGEIRSLLPLMASQIEVKLLPDGSLVYLYSQDGNVDALAAESVWHVKLFGNGVIGKSPLQFGKQVFGISQAAELQTSRIYTNGGKPSGVLSFDKLLTPEQRTQIRQNFGTLTTGTDDRLLVLEMGAKFDQISLSPQDIQLLASRKHQIDEIARWYGVPSILINQNEGTTTLGSSTAEIISVFYKLNLRPFLERFEASMSVNLMGRSDAKVYEPEFDFEGLLRSDLKARMEGYKSAVLSAILTPNEVRRIEGWPRVEGGDSLLAPVNTLPIEKLGAEQLGGNSDGT